MVLKRPAETCDTEQLQLHGSCTCMYTYGAKANLAQLLLVHWVHVLTSATATLRDGGGLGLSLSLLRIRFPLLTS